MYLLLVAVLFTSSCYSVSSHQYYVSDNCSSVTHTPCGPLSNISQYNNTIFYFVGTSYTNDRLLLISVHNITWQGIGYPFPIITCAGQHSEISIQRSNNISILNMTFDCHMNITESNNVTIYNSIIKVFSTVFYDLEAVATISRGKKQYSVTLMNISVQYELHIVIFTQSHNSLLKIDQVKAKGGITIYTYTNSLHSIHITTHHATMQRKDF